jgi:hypothetical protein
MTHFSHSLRSSQSNSLTLKRSLSACPKKKDLKVTLAPHLNTSGAAPSSNFKTLTALGASTSFVGVSSQTIPTAPAGGPLVGPALTYNVAGQLVRVDYDDGRYKTLQYTGDTLESVTFFDTNVTRQRTLNYVDGRLIGVDEVVLP